MCRTALISFAFLLTLSSTCAVRIRVKKCPVTEAAWEARSQDFTCKPPLVYHCIQDDEGNLMETCMEPYRVDPSREGGCPWAAYFRNGDSILAGVFHSCEGIGCPKTNDSDYWTSKLYKYPVCLNHHSKMIEVANSTSFPSLDINKNERCNLTSQSFLLELIFTCEHDWGIMFKLVLCMTFILLSNITSSVMNTSLS